MQYLPQVTLVLALTMCATLGRKQPPNIILFVMDEVGWDDVSFHGSTQIPTPNMDALGADGIILNNFYVQPACTPSRAALLTGLYPIHTGTHHSVLGLAEPWGLPLQFKLLPEYLKDLGYQTHLVGKWHLGGFSKEHTPNYRGFDSFYGFIGGEEDYLNHTNKLDTHVGLDFWLDMEPLRNETGRYSTTLFTERATSLIRTRQKDKPFFLYISHQAAHSGVEVPFAAPARNIEKFWYIGEWNRTMYAAMLDTVDESLGTVMEALFDEHMLDNTIVVVMSDNGGTPFGPHSTRSFNWPLRGVKLTVFEGSTRVAALVWSPLLAKKNRVSMQLMHATDWLPTLYSAAGGNLKDLSSNLDGMDMWRHLSLGLSSPRIEMLYNFDPVDDTAAVRVGNMKLVQGVFNDGGNDGRYKTTGNPRPFDDIEKLTANSTVARLLRSYYGVDDLQFPKGWRQRATVTCGNPKGKRSNFVSGQPPYLFDLKKDPCELYNLANRYPKMVAKLQNKIDLYAATSIPPENKPIDENGFPEKHGGIWAPWI